MKRKLSTFLLLIVIISLNSFVSYAEYLEPEDSMTPTGVLSNNKKYATGINNSEIIQSKNSIIDFVDLNLEISDGRTIRINARTSCFRKANYVGFKNISLQRWNGDRWVNVVRPWEDLVSDRLSHHLSYSRVVEGGYYYKTSLYHYGEHGSGIFAKKQEVYNETGYIWID